MKIEQVFEINCVADEIVRWMNQNLLLDVCNENSNWKSTLVSKVQFGNVEMKCLFYEITNVVCASIVCLVKHQMTLQKCSNFVVVTWFVTFF